MSRRSALAVSLLLALAASAGAYAVLSTAALRAQASKPQVASERDLARRSRQLDRFAAAIARAARSRPPALPRVPRYAPVPTLQAAALGSLPRVAPAPVRTVVAARRRVPSKAVRLAASALPVSGAGSGRFPAEPADPTAAPTPVPTAPVPAPAPPAPAPAPATSAPPPTAGTAHHSDDDGHEHDGGGGGGGGETDD